MGSIEIGSFFRVHSYQIYSSVVNNMGVKEKVGGVASHCFSFVISEFGNKAQNFALKYIAISEGLVLS